MELFGKGKVEAGIVDEDYGVGTAVFDSLENGVVDSADAGVVLDDFYDADDGKLGDVVRERKPGFFHFGSADAVELEVRSRVFKGFYGVGAANVAGSFARYEEDLRHYGRPLILIMESTSM